MLTKGLSLLLFKEKEFGNFFFRKTDFYFDKNIKSLVISIWIFENLF